MSYDGYFTLDGLEIANAARFSTYVEDHGWWQNEVRDQGLADVLTLVDRNMLANSNGEAGVGSLLHGGTVSLASPIGYGANSIKVAGDGASFPAVGWQASGEDFTPGETYTFSVYVRNGPGSHSINAAICLLIQDSTDASTEWYTVVDEVSACTDPAEKIATRRLTKTITITGTVPDTVDLYVYGNDDTAPSTDWFFASAARLEPGFVPTAWSLPQLANYTDPTTDFAPWYDPDEPASGDFYGFYPLSVVGLEDSSRQGDVVESTLDGGVPGRIRHATKEATFSGVIAGQGEAAVEYGMRWLRRALLGNLTSPFDARKQALGAELRYLAVTPFNDPEVETGQQTLERILRVRRHAAVTRGPLVNTTKRLSCGDVLWVVSFTMTIGDPMVYGATKRIFSELFRDNFAWATEPAGVLTEAADYSNVLCGDPVYQPLYDPNCSAVVTPPTPPNVPLGCWTPPTEGEAWQRAWLTIPTNNFRTWAEMIPVLTLGNDTGFELRDVRLRFFRDPTEDFDPLTGDGCLAVSDIVVSYMPTGILVIDGVNEDVHHTAPYGLTRRADSLLFSSNMRPITWPVLDAGMQYVLSVDWRGSGTPNWPSIDLDLIPRAV